MESYPIANLPLPRWGMTARIRTGVEQSVLTSKPRQQRTSYDNENIYTLTWTISEFKARLFRQWYKEKTAQGRKWFSIPLKADGGIVSKTVRFVSPPSVQSINGDVFTYQAEVVSRS